MQVFNVQIFGNDAEIFMKMSCADKKKWIKEFGTKEYPKPIVEHKFARLRALETYKKGLQE